MIECKTLSREVEGWGRESLWEELGCQASECPVPFLWRGSTATRDNSYTNNYWYRIKRSVTSSSLSIATSRLFRSSTGRETGDGQYVSEMTVRHSKAVSGPFPFFRTLCLCNLMTRTHDEH